jgi:hypothetical protein
MRSVIPRTFLTRHPGKAEQKLSEKGEFGIVEICDVSYVLVGGVSAVLTVHEEHWTAYPSCLHLALETDVIFPPLEPIAAQLAAHSGI